MFLQGNAARGLPRRIFFHDFPTLFSSMQVRRSTRFLLKVCHIVARALGSQRNLLHSKSPQSWRGKKIAGPLSLPAMRMSAPFLSSAHALHRESRLRRSRHGHASGGLALPLLQLHPLAIGLGDSRLTSGTGTATTASASASGGRDDSGILLLGQRGVSGAGGCGSGAASTASAAATGGCVGLDASGFARRD